jgi:hypothetical protein
MLGMMQMQRMTRRLAFAAALLAAALAGGLLLLAGGAQAETESGRSAASGMALSKVCRCEVAAG